MQGSRPGLEALVTIAETTGVTLDWLATERGPMRPAEAAVPLGFVPVPFLGIRPSAGAGSLATTSVDDTEIVAFREAWLRRIGVTPAHARLMVARGDSMAETINDGDLMIVDTSIREVVDQGIYVLVYAGMVLLKRIQILRSGALVLKSDNPRYDPEEVPAHEQPDLIVEGRVRWVGGSV